MSDDSKPISKVKRILLLCRAFLGLVVTVFAIPIPLGFYLYIIGINPFHDYESKTCQGILKNYFKFDLPPEEASKIPASIEVDLVEAPPFQSIIQTINHKTFDSTSCYSKVSIDLFGNANLVACYKSKQSGKLSLYDSFGPRSVMVIGLLCMIAFLLGPIRWKVRKIRTIIKQRDIFPKESSTLDESHSIALFSIFLIFIIRVPLEDIGQYLSKNWQRADCKIISICKGEEDKLATVVYEYQTSFGSIRSRNVKSFGTRENQHEIEKVNSFKKDDVVPCYTNPTAPQQSYLFPIRPFSYDRYILFLLGLGLWLWKGWPYVKKKWQEHDSKKALKKEK